MREQIELVSATAEFVDTIEVEFYLTIFGRIPESIGTEGGVVQFCNFGKAIAIGIIGLAIALVSEEGKPLVEVLRDYRSMKRIYS